jgi:hypothetical protein
MAGLTKVKGSGIEDGTLSVDDIADAAVVSLKSGRRNLIINGGFDVWQRGTGRVFGSNTYTSDRWTEGQYQEAGHEKVAVTDTAVPSKSAMRVTSSSTTERSTGTRMALATMLESVDSERYAGKTVTLSFWVRFSAATLAGATGGWYSQLSEYDSVDPVLYATGATRPNSVHIPNGSYPTTWTKYEQTVTCGAGMKNLGARFLFGDAVNTTSNSDFWYEITGVQLEVGSVATDFEHRSYGEELALCQRYYQQLGGVAHNLYATGQLYSSTTGQCILHFEEMRESPTISSTTVTDFGVWNSGASTLEISSLSFAEITVRNVSCVVTRSAGGFSAGNAAVLKDDGLNNSRLYFDAEL